MGVRRGLARGAAAIASTAPAAGVVAGLELLASRGGSLAVLMYHRIARADDRPDLDAALVSATPEAFAAQVAFVAERRDVIGLEHLLAVRRGEASLPPRATLITFDDGYVDFAAEAWPVLRALGVPVTLFVPTAFPESGMPFWWDRLHRLVQETPGETIRVRDLALPVRTADERRDAMSRLRRLIRSLDHDEAMALVEELAETHGVAPPARAVLSWAELRRLRDEGVAIAAHTRTHPLLHRVPRRRAAQEIAGSLDDVRRELGTAPPALAYPGGGFSDDVVAAAAEAGVDVAFTTGRGVVRVPPSDWLRLPRINVGRRANVTVIRAQLIGLRPPVRRRRPLVAGSI